MVGYLIWALRGARSTSARSGCASTLDDGTLDKAWATEARIANGTHHGGVELVESQEIDSGEIVIQAVTGKSLWGLAWSWFATLFKLSAARADHDRVARPRRCGWRRGRGRRSRSTARLPRETPVTVERRATARSKWRRRARAVGS